MKRMLTCALLLLAAASAPLALACDCDPPTPKKAFEVSAAVFTGRCIEVVINDQTLTATFEVDRVWKGDIGPKVTIQTHKSGAACGYGFSTKGDAAYLVYAHRDAKTATLRTGLCSRTATLAEAKEDLKELGDGAKPKAEKK